MPVKKQGDKYKDLQIKLAEKKEHKKKNKRKPGRKKGKEIIIDEVTGEESIILRRNRILTPVNQIAVDIVIGALLDGQTFEQAINVTGISKTRFNSEVRGNDKWKQQVAQAKNTATALASESLVRLAQGAKVREVTYLSLPNNYDLLDKNKIKLINCLDNGDYEGFFSELTQCVSEENLSMKVVEKTLPPNFHAANKILESHNPKEWDVESKRKRIPVTTIKITGSVKDIKLVQKPHGILADFEIITEQEEVKK